MAEVLPFQAVRSLEEAAVPQGTPVRAAQGGGHPHRAGARGDEGDSAEAFHIYRQEFRTESGLEKSRLGVLGILNPSGDAPRGAFPIQDVDPADVASQLEDMTASGCQRKPVVAAVEDLKFDLEKVLERAALLRPGPDTDLELPGERHRLWRIEDRGSIEEISAFFRGRDCFLLDGLDAHRALRRLEDGGPGTPSPLVALFNLFDFGVGLAAATVLVKDIAGFRINDLALRMDPFFEIKAFPFDGASTLPRALTDFREDFRIRGFTDSLVGAYFGGVDQFFLFQLRDGADRDRIFLPDVKKPEQEFDSVLLRRVVLERYLGGAMDRASLAYSWSTEEAIALVRSGKYRCALFVNPPNKRKLLALARSGLRLPPGSARLDPPMRPGLVLRSVSSTGRSRS